MDMKQEIMEKLFAEKPLTNKEILHIGSLFDKESTQEQGTTIMPYDHSIRGSLSKACGLSESDFEQINKLIRSEVMGRKELDCESKQIEVYEKIGLAKPQNFRLLMYQFVKMRNDLQKKGSEAGKLFGRGGGGFGDFLDFMRRGGH